MKYITHSRRLLLAFLGSVPFAAHAQNVGVGTLTPGEKLEVVGGNVKISTSGRGLIFPDGTTQTSAASGTGFVLNQTGTVQAGGFSLGGSGYLGGRLGIGLTSATQVLDVNGGILARGNSAVSTQGAYLQWNRTGGDGETWLLNQQGGGGGNAGIRFGSVTTANVATEWARFLNNGNLGIGTTNPATTLDVRTLDGVTPSAAITVGSSGGGLGALYLGNANHGLKRNYSGGNDVGLFTTSGNVYLSAAGNTSTSQFALLNNGNVGIGTSAPLSRLSISQTTSQTNNTADQNLGEFTFVGFQRTVASASIQALTKNFDDTGHLVFKTSPNGAGAVERMRITADGDVGLGTDSPVSGLHIDRPESNNTTALGVLLSGGSTGNPSIELRGNGKSPYIDFVENTNLDYSTRLLSLGGVLNVQRSSGSGTLLNVQGGLQCVGAVNTSDQRLKQDIRPLGGALASVLALRGVRYRWNTLGVQRGGTANAEQVGVLAQEVEKVYPELVTTSADGYKAVNYAQLTPVLIEALKEQQAQIEALKQEASAAKTEAASAKAEATATTEAFEARLRRLEAAGGQAQR